MLWPDFRGVSTFPIVLPVVKQSFSSGSSDPFVETFPPRRTPCFWEIHQAPEEGGKEKGKGLYLARVLTATGTFCGPGEAGSPVPSNACLPSVDLLILDISDK